ncbi:uncharacterized protein LOC107737421 isoform X2 [Sinocyclocheilus rhinocerous]|uniref:uncharacterized protein LOC107737421 isoform X2 n=1 Tax=Sinocyclocheilus rhinocerous TaxID=307959 RepID=UPI0007BA381C|nr:PREDICTED: uncharacterized protein LOC107737421 isoform X2 [Sinocyclocheilus rhinocerous]
MGPKATYLLLLMCIAIILTSTEAQNHLLGPIQPKPDTFCHDAPQQRRIYPFGKGYPPPRCCDRFRENPKAHSSISFQM